MLTVRIQGNSSQSLGGGSAEVESNATTHSAAVQGGLPTPAALGEVIHSTRQFLIEQVGESLMVFIKRITLTIVVISTLLTW